MPNLTFVINVRLNKTQGKFVSKDELADAVRTEIEGADPGSVYVDDSEYEVSDWEVTDG